MRSDAALNIAHDARGAQVEWPQYWVRTGVVGLLASAMVFGGAAAGHAAPSGQATSVKAAGLAIAQGVLTDHGKGMASADVIAIAWPSQATLEGLAIGAAVPTYVIGRGKTDGAGRFAIDADPASLPPMFHGDGGQVDVELVFGDAAREGRWHYSAAPASDRSAGWVVRGEGRGRPDFHADLGEGVGYDLADNPAAWIGANGKALGATAHARGSLTVTPASRELNQLRAMPLQDLRAARAAIKASERSLAPTEICTPSAGTIQYGLSEYFMQAYAWSGALASVYQRNGNDHTLGIGFSPTGANGSFSQSGTQSTNMAASASRGGVADAYVWNKVNYRDYYSSCSASVTRKPYSVNALLTNFTYTPHVTWSTCSTYTGGTYTKYQGTNVTYGAGMDIGPINVSAQSGWNTNTEISWTVTSRTKLCANSAVGWVSSSLASASRG